MPEASPAGRLDAGANAPSSNFTVFAVAQRPGDLTLLEENVRAMSETLHEIEEERT